MKPSEKLTRACGRVPDLDCEAEAVGHLPGTGEQAQPPTVVERTELAVVPNALQRQSPKPAPGPSQPVTQQGHFCASVSLQLYNGHCTLKFTMVTTTVATPHPGWNRGMWVVLSCRPQGTIENRKHRVSKPRRATYMAHVRRGVSRRASGTLEEATERLSEEEATLAGLETTLKTEQRLNPLFLQRWEKETGKGMQ